MPANLVYQKANGNVSVHVLPDVRCKDWRQKLKQFPEITAIIWAEYLEHADFLLKNSMKSAQCRIIAQTW